MPIDPPLTAGAVVTATLRMHNRAGLSAAAKSSLIMLDDTRPTQKPIRNCAPDSVQIGAYHWLQRSADRLKLCWEPQSFEDAESGIWQLQLQLYHYVGAYNPGQQWHFARDGAWQTGGAGEPLIIARAGAAGETQTLRHFLLTGEVVMDSSAQGGTRVNMDNFGGDTITDTDVGISLQHTKRYSVVLRAVNRAGLYSSDPNINVSQPATQMAVADAGVWVDIDTNLPSVEGARIRLCDPALLPQGTYTHCHANEVGSGLHARLADGTTSHNRTAWSCETHGHKQPSEHGRAGFYATPRQFTELLDATPKPLSKCTTLTTAHDTDDSSEVPLGMAGGRHQPEADQLRMQWEGLDDRDRSEDRHQRTAHAHHHLSTSTGTCTCVCM